MHPLECPHCHQSAFPAWRKLVLGPATSATCRACGGNVTVAWSAMWTVLVIAAAGAISPSLTLAPKTVLWIATLGLACWWNYRLVPLVAKYESQSPQE